MIRLTRMTKRYLWDFCFRLGVFLLVAGIYLLRPRWLDFTQGGAGWPVRLLLWEAVLASMVAQLDPGSGLTTGCMKQYPTGYAAVENYDPQALAQAVKKQNRGAAKVAAVWLAVNLTLGLLHRLKRISVSTLVLLCAFFFLCDLICVLFFCPFQTFLMGNQCCVNCRIFAWGSWMMAAPPDVRVPLVCPIPVLDRGDGFFVLGGAVPPPPGAVLVGIQPDAPVCQLQRTALPL